MTSGAVFGFVIIPVFDLVRVFFIRLINRRSPFRADRNHIHHLMIDKVGLNHWQAAVSIAVLNLLMFLLLYLLGALISGFMMMGIYILLFIFYNVFLYSVADERILVSRRVKFHRAHHHEGHAVKQ